jgi:hypothetical protein
MLHRRWHHLGKRMTMMTWQLLTVNCNHRFHPVSRIMQLQLFNRNASSYQRLNWYSSKHTRKNKQHKWKW